MSYNQRLLSVKFCCPSGWHRRPSRLLRATLAFLGVLALLAASGLQTQAAPLGDTSTGAGTSSRANFPCVWAGFTCGKWIEVNLTRQRLIAHQGSTIAYSTLISSGVAKHPTLTGLFHVYVKLRSDRMTGGVGREHYDLPNVPNVMYFYSGYAIHGAYWHHNFGHPMSHGCINANLSAAAWLFNWTPVGTTVWIHY